MNLISFISAYNRKLRNYFIANVEASYACGFDSIL